MPVPDAFGCRDLEPWGRFLELVERNSAQGEEASQDAKVRSLNGAGFPLDDDLFEISASGQP